MDRKYNHSFFGYHESLCSYVHFEYNWKQYLHCQFWIHFQFELRHRYVMMTHFSFQQRERNISRAISFYTDFDNISKRNPFSNNLYSWLIDSLTVWLMISSTYIVLSLDISLISFLVDKLKDLVCPFFRTYTYGPSLIEFIT